MKRICPLAALLVFVSGSSRYRRPSLSMTFSDSAGRRRRLGWTPVKATTPRKRREARARIRRTHEAADTLEQLSSIPSGGRSVRSAESQDLNRAGAPVDAPAGVSRQAGRDAHRRVHALPTDAWDQAVGSYGPVLARMGVYYLGPTEWLGKDAEWLQMFYETMESDPEMIEYDLTVGTSAEGTKIFSRAVPGRPGRIANVGA